MKAILKMDNITKSFGSGHNKIQALKGINLEVNQGEFVSIIGPDVYKRQPLIFQFVNFQVSQLTKFHQNLHNDILIIMEYP